MANTDSVKQKSEQILRINDWETILNLLTYLISKKFWEKFKLDCKWKFWCYKNFEAYISVQFVQKL
jgi:hypothetical protein